jgi:hypothetical protein
MDFQGTWRHIIAIKKNLKKKRFFFSLEKYGIPDKSGRFSSMNDLVTEV